MFVLFATKTKKNVAKNYFQAKKFMFFQKKLVVKKQIMQYLSYLLMLNQLKSCMKKIDH